MYANDNTITCSSHLEETSEKILITQTKEKYWKGRRFKFYGTVQTEHGYLP